MVVLIINRQYYIQSNYVIDVLYYSNSETKHDLLK